MDVDVRLYCKGKMVSELCFMGYMFIDNCYGLVVSVVVIQVDGYVECEVVKVMINDV